ncbi:MAG: alpha-xylosidase [Lachnospiraceae bacterium]|nr:alpha-xylosidase [Lachnospiraceae bacterium]
MKYHNGCWLFKEGIGCFYPQHVYEVRKGEKEVVLCAPTARIIKKGDTLGGINLTVRISAPSPEVIRVQAYHYKGVLKKAPEFELNLPGDQKLDVTEKDGMLTVRNGHLSLVIDMEQWSMTYERDGKLLTRSAAKDLAYVKKDWKGLPYDKPGNAYMCQQLGLSVDELVYGMGERFTPFVKNGQSVSIWNEDGGTSTEQSYKNIPFYLSNRGYGVFVNHPERVEFEVATEQVSKVGFSVEGESLDYFLINGPSMKEVLERYTDLTGKPALPPQWTFGLWLSTSFTTDYDEKTVMSFIDGMLERGIPLSVFHFDCCWMKEFHWTDFIWDERVFPDPKGMLQRIKAKGVKICVWINSYIGQESALFDEGMEKGYFLKRPNGDVWQWDMWQPGLAIVDFTNPQACRWYQEKLEKLLDMGVDCFKTDFGERIPVDAVYYNGADPVKMHNFYTYLYNKTVYEVLEKKRGKEEAVLFARSATAGGQKFPVHWGGDCWSDYESMEESLRGGLSLTSSGFGFWSHDIGGFESTSTPDVYKRWAAFGLLSTHSRLHGSNSYRVPWAYDEEAVDVVRFFTKLKLELMPYLYSQAVLTSRTGIPMMRSMALEFEGDYNCRYLDKQYMQGDCLLAAPIFNEEGMARYYLPEGTWVNYLTKETVSGGKWRCEKQDYLSVPLWVRADSIIAAGIAFENADYDFKKNLELKVFALETTAETVVYQAGGELVRARFEKEGQTIKGHVTGGAGCRVRLVNCVLADAQGADMEIQGNDTVLALTEEDVTLRGVC